MENGDVLEISEIFCIYCTNLGLTQVPAVTQSAAKYSPLPSKTLQESPETPARTAQQPPHQPQKHPKLRVKSSMEPPTGKLHRYHVFL